MEFRGLKAGYLFLLAGGMVGIFILFIVMYALGLNQWLCVVFNSVLAAGHINMTFKLNSKYGLHGLMKAAARRRIPERMINRKKIGRLIQHPGYENN